MRRASAAVMIAGYAALALVGACGGDAPSEPAPDDPERITSLAFALLDELKQAGDTARITVIGITANGLGRPLAVDSVSFSSLDERVARIAPPGLVIAVGPGSTTIVAMYLSATAHLPIFIPPPPGEP